MNGIGDTCLPLLYRTHARACLIGSQPFSKLPVESPHWGSVGSAPWPSAALTGSRAATFTQQVPATFHATRESAPQKLLWLTREYGGPCWRGSGKKRVSPVRDLRKVPVHKSWGSRVEFGDKLLIEPIEYLCLHKLLGEKRPTSITGYYGA